MHERIAQLAEDATHIMEFDKNDSMLQTSNGEITYEIPAEFVKAFAKLIVKECANVASEQSAIKPEYRIRKHFGVE